MKKLFELLSQILNQNQPAMLVTVVMSHGSTPGGLGASMLVDKTGRRIGTIGGGVVEYKAEQLALKALDEGRPTVESYSLRHGGAKDIGMVCGGDITVNFCYITPGEKAVAFAKRAAASFEENQNVWMLFQLGQDGAGLALYTRANGLVFLDDENPGALAALSTDELGQLMASAPVQRDIGELSFYSEPLVRAGRAVVFGGGHVAQALVPVLSSIGFRTLVYDDRPEFANEALFPTADEIVVAGFDEVDKSLTLTADDWLVIVTRGHNADFEVQRQLLSRRFAYVGVIGSRTKIKSVNARLREAGIPQEAIDLVHTPIGLDIGATTPAEIAISIAGEMIQVRAGKQKQA